MRPHSALIRQHGPVLALLAASLAGLAAARFWRGRRRADKSQVVQLLKGAASADCDKLAAVVLALLNSVEDIAAAFRRTAECSHVDSQNAFGDEQLNLDLLSDKIVFQHLAGTGLVATASSEETPKETPLGGCGFAVAFDPLDGSSIVESNFTVGTIAGVWAGSRLVGVKARDLKAALIALYGPRTTVSLAIDGVSHSHEFTLVPSASGGLLWEHSRVFEAIGEGKLYSPGNLRGTQDNHGYAKLVQHWLTNKYTLRYTGGMVPDCNNILIKGQGIFTNPSSPDAPAKLRLLYEVGPIAYLLEKAGGASSDGRQSILDIVCTHTEQRTQVAIGSKGEVQRFDNVVGYAEPMARQK